MTIGVIGTGYVGLVTSVCLARIGHTVTANDIDEPKIRALKNGRVPFFEPNTEPFLKEAIKKRRISFTSSLPEVLSASEIIFICVGTPPQKNGAPYMKNFKSVIAEIALLASRDKNMRVIVNKSTVPVGTAREAARTIKTAARRAGFEIASNPEFLREGKAVEDFMKPDRIVVGVENPKSAHSRAKDALLSLYSSFNAPKVITGWESAELIKYASNAFLATKISFINEISAVCERVGADVREVAEGMGYDPRIGREFLRAGIGYGGSCFPKDVRALHHLSSGKQYHFKLLKSVIDVNNQQRETAVEKIMKALPNGKRKRVAVLGLTFKPHTDDVRESASIAIIKELHSRGVLVSGYDPKGERNARLELKCLKRARIVLDVWGAVRGADVVFLATEWKEFLLLDWKKVKAVMRGNAVVDGRNVLDSAKLIRLGFRYEGFGSAS